MIVTNDFVWGWIPKNGGTSVWKFFDKNLSHKIIFRSAKHLSFLKMKDEYSSKKYFLLNNKKIKVNNLIIPNYKIANFRRLPDHIIGNPRKHESVYWAWLLASQDHSLQVSRS